MSIHLVPAPALPPDSVKCNSILTRDFAEVQLLFSTMAKPQCPLRTATEPSLLVQVVPKACPRTCKQLQQMPDTGRCSEQGQ